ncbi:CGNR zinc finger domain-containing protein [Streptomyces sp. NPDC002588]|uniref:CGNR zinc finger domain-containing protein n=1 Tax=Streptomyces sp. NPDC002588 TaxID=3154419 RepID=UPI003318FC47
MRYIARVLPPADDWSTRHSVLATARRTAALLNALAGDRPPAPEAVAEVLRAHGEPEPLRLTAEDVDRMRAAGEPLREVFAAEDADRAAELLNRLLSEHTGPLRLTAHAGRTPWHPHLDRSDDGPWDEWLLASSCMALAVLVWDRQRPPGRVCASSSCGNVFVAQGSGPERRYCSRRCATRERVAAHRRSRGARDV